MPKELHNPSLLLDIADDRWLKEKKFSDWHNLIQKITQLIFTTEKIKNTLEVSIVLTNDHQVHTLNKQYRNKDKPTNVLSFQSLSKAEIFTAKKIPYPLMLGDIILSFDTILAESKAEKKKFLDHFHHLIIHGMLHLLGYDHENDPDAEIMQQYEISLLKHFHIKDPY